MKQKKLLFKFLMFFFTFSIIYSILIIGDYYLFLKQYSLREEANNIQNERKWNEDRPSIAKAKKDGYVRIIYPYHYYKVKEVKKKFIKDIVPIGAQPNRNVYDCNEGYGLTKYKTDRFGFRNNDKIWNEILKTKKKKILFIGDSFVNGDCVHDKDVISNNLNQFENINLGLSGNEPFVYSSLAKIFIPVLNPNYVVVVFYANDNTNEGNIFKKNLDINNIHLRYIKNENGKLILSKEIKKITDQVENYILDLEKNYVTGSRPNIFRRGFRYFSLPTIRLNISILYKYYFFKIPDSTKLSIDIINEQCRKYNCIPIFSYMPPSNFWTPDKLNERYKGSIINYLKEENNYFLDFTNILEIMSDSKAYALKGTHLSPEGYKKIADEINNFIQNIN